MSDFANSFTITHKMEFKNQRLMNHVHVVFFQSLMHVLRYRGKVTEPEARYYMKQMVTGVAYIHSQKVVHRDLKPGNMFLSEKMIVKIGDFGLATRPDGQRRKV